MIEHCSDISIIKSASKLLGEKKIKSEFIQVTTVVMGTTGVGVGNIELV